MRQASLLLLSLVVLTACGGPREAGPHEAERGEVFFWQVTASDVAFGDDCTDHPEFRDDVRPLEFEDNSFLLYELSEDGEEAITVSCTTTDADSCQDDEDPLVFAVDGNELVYDPEPELRDSASACDLEVDELWTLIDAGETLEMTVDLTMARVGDPSVCAQEEATIAAQSPNEKAFEGCVVSMIVDLEFYRTDVR